jgi:ribonuclease J
MIVTHGHEDHIGGLAHHLKQFDIPVIYGPRLAIALLQDKLEEAGVLDRTTLKSVLPRDLVKLGKSFSVEFIRNTHSIADSFTVAIRTPLGVLIHTGDFKFDHTPVDGEFFDLQRLAEYGEKGVLCLLSDSTNAEVPGHTPSENSVYPNLERVFIQAPGRLMVTTFASSVHRLSIVIELAQKYKRKVVVVGRSMLNVIAHARNLRYIKCPDDLFEPLRSLKSLPDDKVVILTTGSQGEPLAAMTRISVGEHPHVKVRRGDTIIFSANPIPGNTIAVVNTIDRLMMLGANVIYGKDKGIHVSGHGSQEDHKLMLALTKPKFFIPVHGEHRMLVKHAQMAYTMGIPEENTVILNNGDIVELTTESIRVAGKVPSGIELVDRCGVVHEHVMKDRQQLAEDGVITVAAAINSQGKLLAKPELHLRGVVTTVERSLLKDLMVRSIERTLSDRLGEFMSPGKRINRTALHNDIENALQRIVRRELKSNPLVVFILQGQEITESAADLEPATAPVAPEPEAKPAPIPQPVKTFRRRRSTATVAS